jgi:hypothetical protein
LDHISGLEFDLRVLGVRIREDEKNILILSEGKRAAMNGRTIITIIALLAGVIAQQSAEAASKPAVVWAPVIPDQVFPSVILSTSTVPPKPGASGILCDPHSTFRVRVKSPSPGTRVHIEVMVDGFFTGVSSCDAVLQTADRQYWIAPTPRWDTHKLTFNDEAFPTTVVISVKADGVNLGQKTQRLQIRAVNDVPTRSVDSKGNLHDYSHLFAAFVNENSPIVDQLLHEALQWRGVSEFYGYNYGHASKESVRMQVFAIWNALQHRNVRYSSITRPSAFSEEIQSQSVRFAYQSAGRGEANCVDGSVLFASVLYKIGISPVLVLKPGHMFVGYYLDGNTKAISHSRHDQLAFLETTMLGSGPQPDKQPFDDKWPAITSKSYDEFVAATKKGNEEFWSEVEPNWRSGKSWYRVLSIEKIRKNGFTPIPR